MKNNNFLNWELTQLLPEENPYLSKNHKYYCFVENYSGNRLLKWDVRITGSRKTGTYLRDAWAYEDVRLYLKEKGYKFVEVPARNGLYQIWYKDEMIWDFYKDTYEEAREAGIKYCLELINKKNENTIS